MIKPTKEWCVAKADAEEGVKSVEAGSSQSSGSANRRDNWLALIQVGLGPDVWVKELTICAVDFRDAANQAIAKAEDLGGQVVSLEWSYSPNDRLQRSDDGNLSITELTP